MVPIRVGLALLLLSMKISRTLLLEAEARLKVTVTGASCAAPSSGFHCGMAGAAGDTVTVAQFAASATP